jgi:hypothetical protein
LFVVVAACCATGLLVLATGAAGSHLDQPQKDNGPSANAGHDVSPPLGSIAPAPSQGDGKKEKEPKKGPPVPAQSGSDPVIQASPGGASAPALGLGFEGVGQGFTGPQGTYSVNSAPPDPNAAVSAGYIFEVVNEDIAIFDKSGNVLYGPVPTNTLWSGFGGGCESNDDGDATVKYDQLADRWIVSQFSVSTTPYLQCVAVSTGPDPRGSYNRYSFQYSNFPDYPKLGVWPDAYYTTFNQFKGNTFLGPEVCAYDRNAMLAGQAATQQCFTLGSSTGTLLPSDLDGPTPPPAGSPNYVMSFATNALQLWKFHVDWTTPANSTLAGPTTIPVASFSPACNGGGTCIPQAGTTQQLDSLADRLMYRLAYRNFGDHESLVVNDSVTAGSSTGIRWYELRDPNGTPTVYQQGTYAPDSGSRWMGSIAQDKLGDIALGFSISSSSTHPGIHITARLASDSQLGVMTQGETSIVEGPGSQTGALARWGDYTSMAVDPSDDCTFWYTDEYIPANGSFNWHTRITSFKLPGCGATGNDFSISANPGSVTVGQGASANSTISTAVTSGSAQSVALSATGLPSGATASFSPMSVNAGGSSTLTLSAGSSTPAGSYTVTVTGTGASATHTTSVSFTVTAPVSTSVVNGGFETGSLSGWTTGGVYSPKVVASGHTGSYSAQLGSMGAVNGDSTLTQTIQIPTGTTQLSFWYQPHCTDTITYDQIQAQIRSLSGATLANVLNVCPAGTTAWTNVTFDTSSLAGQTVVLWFNDHDDGYPTDPTYFLLDDVTLGAYTPPPPDFSIAASPTGLTVTPGTSGSSTISTAVTNGTAQAVSLSASGMPTGVSATLNPTSVTAGGSSSLTLTVASTTTPGTYPITVTGTGTTTTHSATVTLTVPAPTPTFTLTPNPASRTVTRGGSTTYTVTVNPVNGFSSSVSLSVSGLPGRTSASFSPSSTTTSSTLTVSTQSRTSRGTYTLTIRGTGGGVTKTTTVTLVVQ